MKIKKGEMERAMARADLGHRFTDVWEMMEAIVYPTKVQKSERVRAAAIAIKHGGSDALIKEIIG